jgi:hypothetical protein
MILIKRQQLLIYNIKTKNVKDLNEQNILIINSTILFISKYFHFYVKTIYKLKFKCYN